MCCNTGESLGDYIGLVMLLAQKHDIQPCLTAQVNNFYLFLSPDFFATLSTISFSLLCLDNGYIIVYCATYTEF